MNARLTSASRTPVRVTYTRWQEQEDEPDSLFVFLSSGRHFEIHWSTEFSLHRVHDGAWKLCQSEEEPVTGLSREQLDELGREVWCRYCEDCDGAER